jgi:hypothetical protein
MRRRALVLALALGIAPLTEARAQAPGEAVAPASSSTAPLDQAELIRKAETAEADHDPRLAASLYRRARDSNPGSRLGRAAAGRLIWLEERSEGDWQPLAELLKLRAMSRDALDAARLAEFEQKLATFPSGRVRREALALVADAEQQHLRRPERAIDAYERLLREPGLDDAERQLAVTGAAVARAALGDEAGAIRVIENAGLGGRHEASALRLQSFRRFSIPLALALLGAFVGISLGFGGYRGLAPRALARAVSRARVALGAYTLLVPIGFALAHSYELFRTIGPLCGACGGVALFSSIASGAAHELSRSRRLSCAALALLAVLAAAYLALDRSGALLGLLTSPRPR